MADRALGLAAPAHAQLADAACPGSPTTGDDPDGFMTAPEVVDVHRALRDRGRRAGAAPTRRSPSVRRGRRRLRRRDRPRDVAGRARSCWRRGRATSPTVPALGGGVPRRLASAGHAARLPSPDQLAEGGVLVVGASATGIQLADELHALRPAGHARRRRARAHAADLPGPRHHLVDRRRPASSTSATTRSTTSSARAHVPSPQLVGTPERATSTSTRSPPRGVALVGPAGAVRDGVALVLRLAAATSARSPTSS